VNEVKEVKEIKEVEERKRIWSGWRWFGRLAGKDFGVLGWPI
jgi:hypothetical protein